MDILPLHIEYLLTRHDCVIVPGIGAFIASEREAYIDMEKGVILPSRREITFNSSVVTDDGLLSHSIARRERMTYEEAHRYMTLLIGKMRSDLLNEKEVSLGMTGRLLMDEEGFINFQPRRSVMNSDILTDVRILKVQSPAAVTSEPIEKTSTPATSENIGDEDGMRTIRVAPDRYVFTISKRAVHAAAMLITILTVGLSLLIPINHDNEQRASVISVESFFHHSLNENKDVKTSGRAAEQEVKNDSVTAKEPAEPLK